MPFSSTPASSAGGTAQLRSRGRSPKIARLVHYTLHTVAWAAGGMRGLCMRACVLVPWKCHFRARFPQLRVSQSCCGAGT